MKKVYIDELVSIWCRHTIEVPDDYNLEKCSKELEDANSEVAHLDI